jgi:hypothetical protein
MSSDERRDSRSCAERQGVLSPSWKSSDNRYERRHGSAIPVAIRSARGLASGGSGCGCQTGVVHHRRWTWDGYLLLEGGVSRWLRGRRDRSSGGCGVRCGRRPTNLLAAKLDVTDAAVRLGVGPTPGTRSVTISCRATLSHARDQRRRCERFRRSVPASMTADGATTNQQHEARERSWSEH